MALDHHTENPQNDREQRAMLSILWMEGLSSCDLEFKLDLLRENKQNKNP